MNPRDQKAIIVSAADENFFFLLQGLILSLGDTGVDADLAVLDLGLEQESVNWLRARDVAVVKTEWAFPFPAQAATPRHLMAIANRPFIREYFRDHEIIIWIDADAYLQDSSAIALLLEGATSSDIAIVPELDRAYIIHRDGGVYRKLIREIWRDCYGAARVGPDFEPRLTFNAGVFAMRRTSLVWPLWQEEVRKIYQRVPFFFAEQTALNHVLYGHVGGAAILPATCNWLMCYGGASLREDGKFYHPCIPHEAISIVHLAGIGNRRTATLPFADATGRLTETNLLYKRGAYLTDGG